MISVVTKLNQALKRQLPLIFVISAAINLLLLTTSVYMLQVLDRVLTSGSQETLIYLTSIAILALGVFGGLEYARRSILSRVGLYCDLVLTPALANAQILRNVATLSGQQQLPPSGPGLVAPIKRFVASENVIAFLDAPWTPIFIVIIALIHPWLGYMTAGGAVILFLIALLNDQTVRPAAERENEAQQTINRTAQEAQNAAETLTALGMRERLIGSLEKAITASIPSQMRTSNVENGWTATSRWLRFVLQIGVLALGAYLVLRAEMTAGGMIAASILLGRALAPVERSITAWRSMVAARQSWASIKAGLAAYHREEPSVALPRPEGRLQFIDVSARIPDTQYYMFRDINAAVEPGKFIVITGPSGSGKSTLGRMIVGLQQPMEGAIKLDEGNISAWHDVNLGQYIGYLPQSMDLMEGSVAQNIARFDEPDPEKVIEAAKMAGIHAFITDLPQGYDTSVGPGGQRLSGGQRQRVALARAFYGDPSVLVLDEPNSHQDANGLAHLLKTFEQLREKKTTTVVIAHDRTIAAQADQLMLLQKGRAQMLHKGNDGFRAANSGGVVHLNTSTAQSGGNNAAETEPKTQAKAE